MRLWKVIDQKANKVLKKSGRLVTEEQVVDKDFRKAYRWMAWQMERRLGSPPKDVKFPQWAWLNWMGTNRRRPDLRTVRHRVPRGQHFLVELEISDDRVLVSDFDRWHFVLNGWYLDLEGKDPEPLEGANRKERGVALETSWEAIFELSKAVDTRLWGKLEERSLQATFWELRLDDVRSWCRFEGAT